MRHKPPLIKIPETGPPDRYAVKEMGGFDRLPKSVRDRINTGKAGEICPAQTLWDVCGDDEERCHKFLDSVEASHRKHFGGKP